MSRLNCSRRELVRAYRIHYNLFLACKKCQEITEMQSAVLILFYATECGLKALWMLQNRVESTDKCSMEFNEFIHDINRVMDSLRIRLEFRLPPGIVTKSSERNIHVRQLNQALRYGCVIDNQNELEKKLVDINEWLRGEL